jgi:N-acetylglucosaminyl-diphospho-decaprenol L-rhamnosyltransferase
VNAIAVVIVSFRGGGRAIRTLDALARAREHLDPGTHLHVVVVDNASRDGTASQISERAPWVKLIEMPDNVGFATGCNIAIRNCTEAELIVLLNPDVDVGEDFLSRVAMLDWPADIAARGPAIVDERGELEQSARGFPRARTGITGRTSLLARLRPQSRLLRSELLADINAGGRVVDWVSGACLIAPAERFRVIGELDQGYFMYWEDADWCYRARTLGYSVVYDPTLVVVHHQGSSSRHRQAASVVQFHRSALRYWRRNVARSGASTGAAAVALTVRCALKLIALGLRNAIDRTGAWR